MTSWNDIKSPKRLATVVSQEIERGFWNYDKGIVDDALDRVLNDRSLLLKLNPKNEEAALKTFASLIKRTADKVLDDIRVETSKPLERDRLVICQSARMGAREYSASAQEKIETRLKMLDESREMRKDYRSVLKQFRRTSRPGSENAHKRTAKSPQAL